MDVTPDAIVSEIFVEVLPEILQTKAADMDGENINPGKNQILQNSHSATHLWREGRGVKLEHEKKGDVQKRKR